MTQKCLVVDDDEFQRNLAAEMVRGLGFDVVVTESAMDAISFVNSKYVDFIMLDWHMPEFNGLEFIEIVRDSKNNIPLFLYSGIEGEDGKTKAEEVGADGFIPKPITQEKMREAFNGYGLVA